jgi:predicted site-specific integrase-resolvase
MAEECYITAREVAGRLGLSPGTILRYYRHGLIPGGRIRPVRFLWSEVEAAWDGQARLGINDRVVA